MRTLQLEFVASPEADIAARLEAAGVSTVAGYDPVPMRGAGTGPGTIVVTVLVPSGVSVDVLRGIEGVLGVMGDPGTGPMR
jgi:hypothetical protein